MEKKMKQDKKKEIIESLNRNYRMVLSYGDKSLMPITEFIVKDIILDDIPEEYSDIISEKDATTVLLTNISNNEEVIEMPLNTFISKCLSNASKNADTLGIATSFSLDSQSITEELQFLLLNEDNFKDNEIDLVENLSRIANLPDGIRDTKLVSLEECKAQYYHNDEESGNNYSLCPIDLGIYREKIRELTYKDHVHKKEPDNLSNMLSYRATHFKENEEEKEDDELTR